MGCTTTFLNIVSMISSGFFSSERQDIKKKNKILHCHRLIGISLGTCQIQLPDIDVVDVLVGRPSLFIEQPQHRSSLRMGPINTSPSKIPIRKMCQKNHTQRIHVWYVYYLHLVDVYSKNGGKYTIHESYGILKDQHGWAAKNFEANDIVKSHQPPKKDYQANFGTFAQQEWGLLPSKHTTRCFFSILIFLLMFSNLFNQTGLTH